MWVSLQIVNWTLTLKFACDLAYGITPAGLRRTLGLRLGVMEQRPTVRGAVSAPGDRHVLTRESHTVQAGCKIKTAAWFHVDTDSRLLLTWSIRKTRSLCPSTFSGPTVIDAVDLLAFCDSVSAASVNRFPAFSAGPLCS